MEKKEKKDMRESAKYLLGWIKSLSWEETDSRSDAHLKFEINPFCDNDGACDTAVKSLSELTFDDVKWMVDSLATERADCFQIDAVTFTYDGDLEEGTIKVESDIHLSEGAD